MVARADIRKSKRPAVNRQSKSPNETLSRAAELADASAPLELSDAVMSRFQRMLDGGIATFIAAFEAKCESMQRKIEVLEVDLGDEQGRRDPQPARAVRAAGAGPGGAPGEN